MRLRAIRSSVHIAIVCVTSLMLFAACSDQELTDPTDWVNYAKGGGGPPGGLDPEVSGAIPPEAPQNTTLDVNVEGANFDDGSSVRFLLAGKPSKNIATNSTRYVNPSNLIANITIAFDADTVDYDIEVTTSRKRRGIGTEMFRVKPGKAVTWAQVELCAKRSVIDDQINSINEMVDLEPWPEINSTAPSCECGDWPKYCPTGTLTYSKAGPEFEWRFSGKGFFPRVHRYTLIYQHTDTWPGRGLVCLQEDVKANRGGQIRFSGSMDLETDLTEAKIWIVRNNWVDCDGTGFTWWPDPSSPEPGVVRMTNDRDGNEVADATESCHPPFGTTGPPPPCDGGLAYDWLFENALITYNRTGVP